MTSIVYESAIYKHYKQCREKGIGHETYTSTYVLAREIVERLRSAYALEKRVDAALAVEMGAS